MNIHELKSNFECTIIAPGDVDYDTARTVFYGGIDKKPAVIIQAANATDVRKAIQLARDSMLELAIRSGGHSPAGFSVSDGGIVIDLRAMQSMSFNALDNTLWADAGLTAVQVVNEADKHNMVIGFGDAGSVGIGGITLGGGIGFLVRKYGLTIDNLLEAEIVTADGQLLNVNQQNHPDLFWAIRGGGGNFGVVTKFKYRLHELKDCFGGMLLLPATPEVISQFITLAAQAPDELSTIINIMPTPPMPFVPTQYHGKLSVMALMMYAGDPKKGEEIAAPFRTLAEPIADMLKPMRYKDIFFPEDPSYHPTAVSGTMMLRTVDLKMATEIINHLASLDAQMRVVQLRVLGGAMARVNSSKTAFYHRQSAILANVAAFYDTEQEKRDRQKWVDAVSADLFQGDKGCYVGFLSPNEHHKIHDAYPNDTWKRLVEVKRKYDPQNLLKLNYNIPPDE